MNFNTKLQEALEKELSRRSALPTQESMITNHFGRGRCNSFDSTIAVKVNTEKRKSEDISTTGTKMTTDEDRQEIAKLNK